MYGPFDGEMPSVRLWGPARLFVAATCALFVVAIVPPASSPRPSLPRKPKPPAACVVPDVTLTPFAAAKRAIVKHHCRVGRVTRIYSFQVPRGRVIAQTPWGGRRLKHGARVSLVVSRGRPPG